MLPRAAAIRETTPVNARNSEIASVFDETADLLEIEGENPFRIRVYRNAARLLRSLKQEAVTARARRSVDPWQCGYGASIVLYEQNTWREVP